MQIFSLLSGILWLGNVQFDAASEDAVLVRQDSTLKKTATLLGVDPVTLSAALCCRNITAGLRFAILRSGSAKFLGRSLNRLFMT